MLENKLANRLVESDIELAARETGVKLCVDQIQQMVEVEQNCLYELKRVSFSGGTVSQLIRNFGDSPYFTGEADAEVLANLIEAFYELRENFLAQTSDEEIIEALRKAFDGEAAGDVAVATAMTREALAREESFTSYEIIDDDGRVYRWNPEEWNDDITADGWYGERWKDIYE